MIEASAYVSGDPWAICDRCGERHRHSRMAKEWTGLLVCKATCLDPRPPEMTPPKIWPEGVPINDPRPYPPDTFVGPGDVTPGDL